MQDQKNDQIIDLIRKFELYQKAVDLSKDPSLVQALNDALIDNELKGSSENPLELLKKNSSDLKEKLGEFDIKLIKGLEEIKPFPNELFVVGLSMCRTYWVNDEPGQPPRQQTVCFGIKIIPKDFPHKPRIK